MDPAIDPTTDLTINPTTDLTIDPDRLVLGRKLFKKAMEGKWSEVVDLCKVNPWFLAADIKYWMDDTLLHLAVSDYQEHTVQQLIDIIFEIPNWEALLRAKNRMGNTPLHIAAMMGNEDMCKCIASADFSLIGERNDEGETPLFTAVLFGKKQAFECLHDLCLFGESYSYSRNTLGDTILHCAISGDHFDLALRIIELYGEALVNAANKKGITPLHLLADKPSAFPSGSRLVVGLCKTIIYHCILVDRDQVLEPVQDDQHYEYQRRPSNGRNPNDPENFRTCGVKYFFRMLWNFVTFVLVGIRKNGVQLDEENLERQSENPELISTNGAGRRHRSFPANYGRFYKILKLASRAMVIVFGLGSPTIKKLHEEKQRHKLSIKIMNELLKGPNMYEYYHAGTKPSSQPSDRTGEDPYSSVFSGNIGDSSHEVLDDENREGNIMKAKRSERESPILIAARNGISEIVQKILDLFPIAIHDVNEENKNVLLLAVQNRQPHILQILLNKRKFGLRDRVFRVVDIYGNSAFHLAAQIGEYNPWLIPGEALQMQWEMKWFEFVTESIPANSLPRYNMDGKTPEELFIKNHKDLVKEGGKWLIKTSESYSLVAALIATVAFATSTTVPGGVKEGVGTPLLENKPPFHLFVISSLIALCFSITALVTFLSILTSRNKERDFGKDLPIKLLIGLTSLFFSIVAVLITFCSGHFFTIEDNLRYVAYPVYAATCLPVTFFAVMQFPLYFDLIHSTFRKVPRRSNEESVL